MELAAPTRYFVQQDLYEMFLLFTRRPHPSLGARAVFVQWSRVLCLPDAGSTSAYGDDKSCPSVRIV